MWAKIRRLGQEACYGCSSRKTDERHHNTCQMSDEDCIHRFMEMALGDVRCLEVIRWVVWFESPFVGKRNVVVSHTVGSATNGAS